MLKLVIMLTVVLGFGWLSTVGWGEAGASVASQVQRQA
jgi:hypothetical protein